MLPDVPGDIGKKLQSVSPPFTCRQRGNFAGRVGMATEYRVYAIGQDGRIFDATVLVCGDDAEAIEKAKDAFEAR